MKVFISGISGFIGRRLALEYAKGSNEVYGVGFRRNEDELQKYWGNYVDKIECKEIDILDAISIRDYMVQVRPYIVHHLAAQANIPTSKQNPVSTYRLNVEGSYNIITAADASYVRVIHLASSSDVYGPIHSNLQPIVETQPLNGCGPYATSKIAMEGIGKYYQQENELATVVTTRLFTTAGTGQYLDAVLSYFAWQTIQIKLELQEPTFKCGNIDNYRTFCDVDEVVKAFMLIPDIKVWDGITFEDTIFNITGDKVVSLRQLVEYLFKIAEISPEIEESGKRKGDVTYQHGDGSKFHTATNWKFQVGPFELVRKIYQYWLEKLS